MKKTLWRPIWGSNALQPVRQLAVLDGVGWSEGQLSGHVADVHRLKRVEYRDGRHAEQLAGLYQSFWGGEGPRVGGSIDLCCVRSEV